MREQGENIIFYIKKIYFWLKRAFNYGMLVVDVFFKGGYFYERNEGNN